MLSKHKDNKHINRKERGINLKEPKLHPILNNLNPIMIINRVFILNKQKNQNAKQDPQHHRRLKGKEYGKGPYLKQHYQLELDGKAWVLHLLVQDLLAAVGFKLVFHLF